MNEKYFKVLAKCGHVGRNKYILKWFYIKSNNSKEAARNVILKPRVKHCHKDVIRQVCEIDFNNYCYGLNKTNKDDYFKINNSSAQKIYNYYHLENIYYEETKENEKEKDKCKMFLKNKIIKKETRKLLQGGIYD